jgi:hypothetical protein
MRLRRVLVCACCSLACAGIWAYSALGASRPPRRAPAPARLLVYAQEWSLWPSRSSLPSGNVTVQLWNRGQDSHDLRIRRLNRAGTMVGGLRGGVRVTLSGGLSTANWKLAPGRYELYCSLPGHRMRGMHTVVVVR